MRKIPYNTAKELKEIAAQLPSTAIGRARAYKTVRLYDNQHNEVKNSTHGDAPMIVREAPKVRAYDEVYVKVNHLKKLKKAFIKNGWSGVMEYITWVRDNNVSIVNASRMEIGMITINEIMKHKIKPLF